MDRREERRVALAAAAGRADDEQVRAERDGRPEEAAGPGAVHVLPPPPPFYRPGTGLCRGAVTRGAVTRGAVI